MAKFRFPRGRTFDAISLLVTLLVLAAVAGWQLWPIAAEFWVERTGTGIAGFGNKPKASVSELVADLGSTSATVRFKAVEALVEVGPSAVPEVVRALRGCESISFWQKLALPCKDLGRVKPPF